MNRAPSSRILYAENIGVLVGQAHLELVRATEAELQACSVELRFTQLLMLKRLASMGSMSASELARAVELNGGAMTRQLDQLESRGLLRRLPNEQDRRALRIALTPAGDALLRRTIPSNDRVLETAQRALNTEERSQLRDYLERVLQALRDKT